MADMISKLKTAALIAGATLLVVACGEKKTETTTEVTTEAAPADVIVAPAPDAMAVPAADAATTETTTTIAPAADAMAPAADVSTTTTTTEKK